MAELSPMRPRATSSRRPRLSSAATCSWTLAALRRHFFTGGDARPILAALQNRNRILIQFRAPWPTPARPGSAPAGSTACPRGARLRRALWRGPGGEELLQCLHPEPLVPRQAGRVAAKLPPLRRLIDNQREFVDRLRKIIRPPDEQEEVLRDMAVRCLAA